MRKPQPQQSVVNIDKNNSKFYKGAIFPVASKNGKLEIQNFTECYFLINPSSIEENKSVNWVSQTIPGQSDPILQWSSGGSRTVSFEALVTRDYSSISEPPKGVGSLVQLGISVLGNVASKFAGVNLPAITDLVSSFTSGSGNELDISAHLNFYRSLLYPIVDNKSNRLIQSPPLVALGFNTSLNAIQLGKDIGPKTDLYVVTNLRIRITKQLPNLKPMEATVSFQLTEYPRENKTRETVVGVKSVDVSSVTSAVSNLLG